MRTNYKFHAMAISTLCVVITVLYFLIGPKPEVPADQQPVGSRYITIYSATWGENCNEAIQQTLAARTHIPLNKDKDKDADGNPIEHEKLQKVLPNNALSAMSALCNGKLSCNMRVDSETIGFDPMMSCFKKLQVSYRCYSYDRLISQSLNDGDTLAMNCAPDAVAPPANPQ
ncbi:MAG: hypothetical protein V4735_01830 [Pseudomonadota bacterium]